MAWTMSERLLYPKGMVALVCRHEGRYKKAVCLSALWVAVSWHSPCLCTYHLIQMISAEGRTWQRLALRFVPMAVRLTGLWGLLLACRIRKIRAKLDARTCRMRIPPKIDTTEMVIR